MTLGEKIRTSRKSKGYTLEGLGDLIGVSKEAVRLWESGGKISPANLQKIAELFDQDVSYFIPEEPLPSNLTSDNLSSTGDRIKYLRISRGLSQVDLSEKSGVSQSVISQIENNLTGRLSAQNLDLLANFFEVPAAYLISTNKPQPKNSTDADLMSHLRELVEFKNGGMINENEFKGLKADLFKRFSIDIPSD